MCYHIHHDESEVTKYEPKLKTKPTFLITMKPYPSLRIEHILANVKDYIKKNFKYLLQLMPTPSTLSTCSQSEALPSMSITCSKMMIEL